MKKISLDEIEQQIDKAWSPVDVAEFNGQVLRVAIFEGEYHWHVHENEDEFFLIYKGEIIIETEEGDINLKAGQGTVIPKGLRHRPIAKEKSFVLMVEPEALNSKGDDK
ncbi:cupin domain-containing protein [Candidatus Parcubacteria bacterium]|nr:MAG: cupin domain-containing protein [Candidatus Parcubacteria bacterium]